MASRLAVSAAATATVLVGVTLLVLLMARHRSRRRLRLAILNPVDGSLYNRNFRTMFRELGVLCGWDTATELVEFDVRGGANGTEPSAYPESYADFDGVVIPGSAADAFAPEE